MTSLIKLLMLLSLWRRMGLDGIWSLQNDGAFIKFIK
jgi:hypothetical protein